MKERSESAMRKERRPTKGQGRRRIAEAKTVRRERVGQQISRSEVKEQEVRGRGGQ